MSVVKVDPDDESTLPPLDKVVWIYYPSGYDNSPIVQLGGRSQFDGPEEGWLWGALDSMDLGKNWGPSLCALVNDDDYPVTHWAEVEWPPEREVQP